jgi:hypothetical protein
LLTFLENYFHLLTGGLNELSKSLKSHHLRLQATNIELSLMGLFAILQPSEGLQEADHLFLQVGAVLADANKAMVGVTQEGLL